MGEVCNSTNGLRNGDKEKFVLICHQTGTQGPENAIRQKLHTCVEGNIEKASVTRQWRSSMQDRSVQEIHCIGESLMETSHTALPRNKMKLHPGIGTR